MDEQESERVWLPLNEAARRLNLSTEAVRARIRRGQIESRRGNDGRLTVLVDVQPESEQRSASPNSDETILRLRAEIDEARADADHWRGLAEERGERAIRAEERAEAARAVATADVEAARRVAEAEIAAKQELIEELKAMLAEARRPWWRRWRG